MHPTGSGVDHVLPSQGELRDSGAPMDQLVKLVDAAAKPVDRADRVAVFADPVNGSAPHHNWKDRGEEFFKVEEKEPESHIFNESLARSEAVLETVARVDRHHHHHSENQTQSDAGALDQDRDEENGDDNVARLIDSHDNEYILTKPRSGTAQMELKEDFALISDLVQLIVAAALGGLLFGLLRLPVILGYLVAGSVVGPGGMGLIDELVQVETLAQFGVVFLLFVLGIEFNPAKVHKVRQVAVFGGSLQMLFSMLIGLGMAGLLGAPLMQGCFVGAIVSMSSTAVVLKCLMDYNAVHSMHGQVMLGTLILQDCSLGLILAIMPNLVVDKNHTTWMLGMKILRELATLVVFMFVAYVCSRAVMPPFLRLLSQLSRETEELFQMGVVAVCLALALFSEFLGLSIEVGAFVAGLMLSGPEYSERTLRQVEPVRNIFAALFLASVGMLMHPAFLWHHLDVLLASLALLFVGKAILIASVVRLFGYPPQVALSVGIALSQIGEFAFVLLSRAKSIGLVSRTLYLLLLGTTALSLCFTPFAFRWMQKFVMQQSGSFAVEKAPTSPVASDRSGLPPLAPTSSVDGLPITVSKLLRQRTLTEGTVPGHTINTLHPHLRVPGSMENLRGLAVSDLTTEADSVGVMTFHRDKLNAE